MSQLLRKFSAFFFFFEDKEVVGIAYKGNKHHLLLQLSQALPNKPILARATAVPSIRR